MPVRQAFWLFAAFLLLLPAHVGNAQIVGRTSQCPPGQLCNPIKFGTIPEFIEALLGIVLQIGVPVAAFFLIYSGFLFVFARGDVDQIKQAKSTFMWTVVGTAVLLGAWVLAKAIGGTIEQIRR